MRSKDFLAALGKAMPGRAELEDYGLEPEEIDSVQSSFKAAIRKSVADDVVVKSELEKMIRQYDCSNVEVGLIRFLSEPRVYRWGIQVAYCEADFIVVQASGTVAMHDHDDVGKFLKCAAHSELFLDALSIYITLLREKTRWKGRAEEAAKLCADKAGGDDCIPFFRMLCGFLGADEKRK